MMRQMTPVDSRRIPEGLASPAEWLQNMVDPSADAGDED
jgi:hypothetical protein